MQPRNALSITTQTVTSFPSLVKGAMVQCIAGACTLFGACPCTGRALTALSTILAWPSRLLPVCYDAHFFRKTRNSEDAACKDADDRFPFKISARWPVRAVQAAPPLSSASASALLRLGCSEERHWQLRNLQNCLRFDLQFLSRAFPAAAGGARGGTSAMTRCRAGTRCLPITARDSRGCRTFQSCVLFAPATAAADALLSKETSSFPSAPGVRLHVRAATAFVP